MNFERIVGTFEWDFKKGKRDASRDGKLKFSVRIEDFRSICCLEQLGVILEQFCMSSSGKIF